MRTPSWLKMLITCAGLPAAADIACGIRVSNSAASPRVRTRSWSPSRSRSPSPRSAPKNPATAAIASAPPAGAASPCQPPTQPLVQGEDDEERELPLPDTAPSPEEHLENSELGRELAAALDEVLRLKPSASKGRFLTKATISTTMGPGIPVDVTKTRNLLEEDGEA